MITQERLKELLRYEPETGKFYWKVGGTNQVKIGMQAGHMGNRRYGVIKIDSKNYSIHKLVWLYHHGCMPNKLIDHINGNTHDNRIENLRLCDYKENARNRRISSTNTTGVKGLGINKNKGYCYYRVDLTLTNGLKIRRQFPYTEEGKASAIEFIREARQSDHGEFARHE